jgi:hypothetical protein
MTKLGYSHQEMKALGVEGKVKVMAETGSGKGRGRGSEIGSG